jgi:hypothetical protein
MTYEEFKKAWISQSLEEHVALSKGYVDTSNKDSLTKCFSSLFDWIYPAQFKENYEASLATGELQERILRGFLETIN